MQSTASPRGSVRSNKYRLTRRARQRSGAKLWRKSGRSEREGRGPDRTGRGIPRSSIGASSRRSATRASTRASVWQSNSPPSAELARYSAARGGWSRCRRWHLTTTSPPGALGQIEIPGAGKKHGEVVILTSEQRRAVDDALAGYLANYEAARLAGQIDDYYLFPG